MASRRSLLDLPDMTVAMLELDKKQENVHVAAEPAAGQGRARAAAVEGDGCVSALHACPAAARSARLQAAPRAPTARGGGARRRTAPHRLGGARPCVVGLTDGCGTQGGARRGQRGRRHVHFQDGSRRGVCLAPGACGAQPQRLASVLSPCPARPSCASAWPSPPCATSMRTRTCTRPVAPARRERCSSPAID